MHHATTRGPQVMRAGLIITALLVGLLMAVPAQAAAYRTLASWDTIDQGGSGFVLMGSVIDGDTSYHIVSVLGNRITSVSDLGGSPVFSEQVSTGAWDAVAGSPSSISGIYGLELSGQYLQFADSTTDQIYRVDTTAPDTVSVYASKSAIQNHLTDSFSITDAPRLVSPHTAHPTSGEHYFYESVSQSILQTAGQDTIGTVLSSSQIAGVAGNSEVDGGITFDSAGKLYWASDESGSIYAWDGSGSTVLGSSQILALTGLDEVGFGDLFYAPDGQIYFYESRAQSILAFDPTDPAQSLSTVLSKAELAAGPAGTADNVSQLTWWSGPDGGIAWSVISGDGKGLYAVPEPTSLAMLSLGGLALLRRRPGRV